MQTTPCCRLTVMRGRDLDMPAPGDHPLIVIKYLSPTQVLAFIQEIDDNKMAPEVMFLLLLTDSKDAYTL